MDFHDNRELLKVNARELLEVLEGHKEAVIEEVAWLSAAEARVQRLLDRLEKRERHVSEFRGAQDG
jgi:DNA-directed RNA polymerase sigma subunit (sigma70/sigma32)